MDLGAVRPEFLVPEARPFLLAHLEMLNGRMEMVSALRRSGLAPGMTFLDGLVSFYVFVFAIIGGDGSTQAEITEAIAAPRSTIIDAINHCVSAGLVAKTGKGRAARYHTTTLAINGSNQHFDNNLRQMIRVAETLQAYRSAISR